MGPHGYDEYGQRRQVLFRPYDQGVRGRDLEAGFRDRVIACGRRLCLSFPEETGAERKSALEREDPGICASAYSRVLSTFIRLARDTRDF